MKTIAKKLASTAEYSRPSAIMTAVCVERGFAESDEMEGDLYGDGTDLDGWGSNNEME